MSVFHLFPPIDQVKAVERAERLHSQAVLTSTTIIAELFDSLPLEERKGAEEGEKEEEREEGEEGEKDRDGVEEGGEEDNNEEKEEGEGGEAGEEEGGEKEGEEGVTEEQRVMDRKLRLRLYLSLLTLACAMVGGAGIGCIVAGGPSTNISH